MKALVTLGVMVGLLGLFAGGCATSPETETGKSNLSDDASVALRRMQSSDPTLNDFLSHTYGYALFPSVGKGAIGVGGA